MEKNILNELNFNLTVPTSLRFIERYYKLLNIENKILYMSRYISELCLIDYDILKYSPNEIAIGSILISSRLNNNVPFDL